MSLLVLMAVLCPSSSSDAVTTVAQAVEAAKRAHIWAPEWAAAGTSLPLVIHGDCDALLGPDVPIKRIAQYCAPMRGYEAPVHCSAVVAAADGTTVQVHLIGELGKPVPTKMFVRCHAVFPACPVEPWGVLYGIDRDAAREICEIWQAGGSVMARYADTTTPVRKMMFDGFKEGHVLAWFDRSDLFHPDDFVPRYAAVPSGWIEVTSVHKTFPALLAFLRSAGDSWEFQLWVNDCQTFSGAVVHWATGQRVIRPNDGLPMVVQRVCALSRAANAAPVESRNSDEVAQTVATLEEDLAVLLHKRM